MPVIQSTVRVSDIPSIVHDPGRGVISLVGDHGGTALITGDMNASSLVFGTIAFETEHGTLFLDPDAETQINEELPLDAGHEWLVSWNIDSYGPSPESAAAKVWVDHFGRTAAGSDDACAFTVTDSESGKVTNIDLSEFDLDSLTE